MTAKRPGASDRFTCRTINPPPPLFLPTSLPPPYTARVEKDLSRPGVSRFQTPSRAAASSPLKPLFQTVSSKCFRLAVPPLDKQKSVKPASSALVLSPYRKVGTTVDLNFLLANRHHGRFCGGIESPLTNGEAFRPLSRPVSGPKP